MRKHHMYVVGSNLISPESDGHIGVFYQTNNIQH